MEKSDFLISKISNASEIHKNTFLSGLSRFTYLPSWLLFEAKMHEKECKSKQHNKYPYFKRGTIVMIDFGVNIDSEFSGKHFAIILNKKDNPNNPVLTVLPLTSKGGNNRFSIGKELFTQTVHLLQKNVNLMGQEYTDIELTSIELDNDINETTKGIENIKKYIESNTVNSNDVKEDLEKVISAADKISAVHESYSKKISELKKNKKSILKVIDIYSKYNNESFVRISDIKTISKYRINKINKFDPSGKIKLSNEIMNKISTELIKLYASR
ncbi:hypothetical protein CKN86_02410 [Carnobacterium divergens]|uniref:type II toxin-antitoxin system PemK/MazF family toxin n=1 Tax=Carnobacterium divergens TaxID=2748 RepID=UPI000D4D9520|nr:type II toxin-antitoxin system PemK/MazF family toxin [Carnobacterium divergens]MCO6018232.1 type II toxin-antitoxin system PemK/MazF family toxin [Carnobacterium divergens]TFI64637.1 hypothetical protein CKN62_02410 [Carnobacterium divergens]TFI91506.1 hypothetical protein CKN84_02410 [Carnobacterium divergens]TFJ06562.1 hypothetical protein CKN86_02410 [Carnobacterium divergens]TFJ07915.1 hypothetical protein CKN65_02415 [Carnobacterium divergens]